MKTINKKVSEKVNTKSYPAKDGKKPTSYDTSRPETDTPQEVRENEEPTAEQIWKGSQEPKDGGSKQPG